MYSRVGVFTRSNQKTEIREKKYYPIHQWLTPERSNLVADGRPRILGGRCLWSKSYIRNH